MMVDKMKKKKRKNCKISGDFNTYRFFSMTNSYSITHQLSFIELQYPSTYAKVWSMRRGDCNKYFFLPTHYSVKQLWIKACKECLLRQKIGNYCKKKELWCLAHILENKSRKRRKIAKNIFFLPNPSVKQLKM